MTEHYYTGVGSRSTPVEIQRAMTDIAIELEVMGYTLRSGGAKGADQAFERGAVRKEIYLPEKGYKGHQSDLYTVCDRALAMALDIHPAPNKLKANPGPWRLHARNCYQVLGQTLDNPSEFLIGWTENGELRGGTRTAIVLAKRNKIPTLNLGTFQTYLNCMYAFERFHLAYGT